MVVICNRIQVNPGHEADFEKMFLERDESQILHPLSAQPGFIRNDILRPTRGEPHVVLTYWESREAFETWTHSASFKEAHSGRPRPEIFAGPPHLEIHEVIRSTVPGK